jgi:hypothetical protein
LEALSAISEDVRCQIHLQFISILDPCSFHFDGQQASVDTIPEENASDGGSDDGIHTKPLEYKHGMFSARSNTEISSANYDISRPDRRSEFGSNVFQSMFSQFRKVSSQVGISAWYDQVCADILTERPRTTSENHGRNLLGSVIRPSIAEAAHVAGLAK